MLERPEQSGDDERERAGEPGGGRGELGPGETHAGRERHGP
jgi:hypothetical protein